MFSDQQKSYAAGYTDAEGCIGVYRKPTGWALIVAFKQTRPDVIDQLHAEYGGSFTFEKQKRGRPLKHWRLQALDEAKRFLVDVLPYLREKREQADLVLAKFDPRAAHVDNMILAQRLGDLKDKRISDVAIQSRLAIAARDPNRKCLDCGAPAFARDFCSKHYASAKYHGRIVANKKGEGVPFTYGRPLAPLDAPYFAGYFDGDGSVGLRPEGRRWHPRIAFGQTQPDVVIDLHQIYGGSLKVQKGKGVDPKPLLFYQLTQRQAVLAMLRDIQPFSVEKRDQVDLIVNTFDPNMSFENGQAMQEQLSTMKKWVMQVESVL